MIHNSIKFECGLVNCGDIIYMQIHDIKIFDKILLKIFCWTLKSQINLSKHKLQKISYY